MPAKFTKLTRPGMRNLAPGQKATENGINFERLEGGDGRFEVNVMVDGQRIHRVVGLESEGVTREQAEQLIEQLRTDARHGRLNLPKARKTPLKFEEAAARYLARLAEGQGKDLRMKRVRFRMHLTPFFGAKPLEGITSFDLERYKKARAEAGAAPSTVNRELAAFSHLYSKAVEWKWLSHKPMKLERLKEGNGRITYLTQEQITRLLEAARQSPNLQVYPFIVIGLETGMRKMEILSIRLEHIDLARRVIYIQQAKAGAREQPITAHLAEFLSDYLEQAAPGQEWLFPSDSATGHTVEIRKAFRAVVQAAGMDPDEVVRHTLRHTAITHLVQAGVDLPTVKRISGHKTLLMVERYAHQNGEHIQAAMDKLERRIRGSGFPA